MNVDTNRENTNNIDLSAHAKHQFRTGPLDLQYQKRDQEIKTTYTLREEETTELKGSTVCI